METESSSRAVESKKLPQEPFLMTENDDDKIPCGNEDDEKPRLQRIFAGGRKQKWEQYATVTLALYPGSLYEPGFEATRRHTVPGMLHVNISKGRARES